MPVPAFNPAAARIADRIGSVACGWAQVRVLRLHDVAVPAQRQVGSHAHAWFELSVVAAGAVEYHCGNSARTLRRGATFAMPPGVRHGWACDAPALITGWQLLLTPARETDRAVHERWCRRLADGGWSLPSHPLGGALADELHALAAGGPAALPAGCALARAQLCWALDRLGLREAVDPGPPAAGERLPRLRDFILEHLAEPLPLAALARRFGVGPRQLARSFAAGTGQPLHRFITSERLDRAAHALRSGDAPVAAVARSVGYVNPAWFGRLFRARFGISPDRWRRRERG